MPHKTLINGEQLTIAVYLCLVCDSLIRPIAGGASIEAYGRIFGAFICATLVFVIFKIFLKKCRQEEFTAMLAGKSKGSSVVLVLLAACFLFGAARSVQQSETFYRYAGGQSLPLTLFLVILLGICLYSAKAGLESLLRTGVILSVFLVGSLLLIVVANAPQMRLQNLQIPNQPIQSILKSCMAGFNLTPELLLIAVFGHSCRQQKTVGMLAKILMLVVFSDLLFTIVSELILGQFEALQVQPIHTLARLGGISVFRRLDAVHVSIWLLIAVFRTAILCAGLVDVIRPLVSKAKKQFVVWTMAIPIFLLALLMYTVPELAQQWIETSLVFLAGISIVISMRKGQVHV